MQKKLSDWFNTAIHLFSGQGARQGYLSAIDQALISLANFIATLILARNASPMELGVYGVGFTALRLARSIQEGITIQPLNTIGAGMDKASFRSYATSTSLIQVILSLISAAGVALVGWIVTRMGKDVAGPTLFALWSCFLWWQLQEYLRRMMYTRGMVRDAVLNTAIANIIRLVLMVWWVNQGKLNGVSSLNAIAWGSLVALLPGLWQTRSYWSRGFDDLRLTWKRNWGFGRWMLGGLLANWVSLEFYPVLTAGMINFSAAGAYRALQNLVAPLQLILRAMDTFLTPRASQAYQENGTPALTRQVRLAYLVMGIPFLGVLAFAILFRYPILNILYGNTYLPYANGIIIMAIFYALLFAYWPLQTALKAMRSSRPIFIANLVAIVAMFTLGIWMILQWNVYGTIAGQALNALIVTIVLWMAWRNLNS
jgi:O-antigen/teichoic acid export membrane protein